MRSWRYLRDPLLAGMVWALVALGTFALRDGLGAVLLLWAPSAVGVAAFHTVPRRRWPLLLAVMFPLHVGSIVLGDVPLLQACVYSLASLVQSLIAASMGIAVVGGRNQLPRNFHQVAGVFFAAISGCAVGALIAFPFRSEQTLAEFGWWFLANVLAILILTPVLTLAREMLRLRRRGGVPGYDRTIVLPLFACIALAVTTLQLQMPAIVPLLTAAMVYMTVRFGHVASALVALIIVGAATYTSLGGAAPVPFLGLERDLAALVVQCWLFILLATVLPVAAMLLKRDELERELVARNAQMHDNQLLFELAEQVAGIGRWRLDLVSGAQDWSPKMLELNGLPVSLAPDPGDITGLMPDGGEELFSQIAAHRDDHDAYSFTYSITPPGQPERILRISILNEFDAEGRRIAVFGAALDVTEQVRREEALELAHGRAVQLAAEAQKLANTDPLTGLPNRRHTFGRLKTMIEVAGKRGGNLTAVIFDIDHFKRVNDRHGHQTGDEVLVEVAELARRQARAGDVVGRIGGEEFVWLLPALSDDAARALAERLRRSVARGTEGSRLPSVTVSIGLAHFRPSDSGESLLARADAALYAAKESGRNRVTRAA